MLIMRSRYFSFAVIIVFFLSPNTFCQITINQNHVETIFGAGKTTFIYADTSSEITVDVGKPGAANIYDFSGLRLVLVDTARIIPVNQVSQLLAHFPEDALSLRTLNDQSRRGLSISETYQRATSADIFGTWLNTTSENDLLLISFLEDGSYLHAEVELDSPQEPSGMEWGTFQRNENDGRLSVAQLFDNNGETGLSGFTGDGPPFVYINISADSLIATVDENGDDIIDETTVFIRALSSGTYGTWLNLNRQDDLFVVCVFEDDTYLHMEVDFDDTEEISGMEWGSFQRSPVDGLMEVEIIFDNNGDNGLTDYSQPGSPFLYVNLVQDDLVVSTHDKNYYYDIIHLRDDGVYITGEANISTASESYAHFSNEEQFIPFPLTYGYSNSYSATKYDTTYIEDEFLTNEVSNLEVEKLADGWGTLLLPEVGSLNCLRWKEIADDCTAFNFLTHEGYFLQILAENTVADSGVISAFQAALFVPEFVTMLESAENSFKGYDLLSNYPNPFNPKTTITYNIENSSHVSLKVYNIYGQQIRTLVNGTAGI